MEFLENSDPEKIKNPPKIARKVHFSGDSPFTMHLVCTLLINGACLILPANGVLITGSL